MPMNMTMTMSNAITKETVEFYLKSLQTIYQYSMNKISSDTSLKKDALYYVRGNNQPSEKTLVYIMYKLRQTYPNEMSTIDSAAVAISENVKEQITNVHVQTK